MAKNENFVIFARPKANDFGEIPQIINRGDIMNIFEFIYEVLLKRCFSAENISCDLYLEIDISACEWIKDIIELMPQIKPWASHLAVSPMTRAFHNEMQRT